MVEIFKSYFRIGALLWIIIIMLVFVFIRPRNSRTLKGSLVVRIGGMFMSLSAKNCQVKKYKSIN